MTDYRWYVAQALPGLEATAVYNLSREGITGYAPAAVGGKTGAQKCGRLFPGYVFVELESPDEAGIVNRTRGIHRVLPVHADEPLPLPQGFVTDLRGRIAGGEFDVVAQERFFRKYLPGEDVAIVAGPFAGFSGTMVRYRKGSLIILLKLFGGQPREIAIPRALAA